MFWQGHYEQDYRDGGGGGIMQDSRFCSKCGKEMEDVGKEGTRIKITIDSLTDEITLCPLCNTEYKVMRISQVKGVASFLLGFKEE